MPETIEDREQMYALLYEFDDRVKAMKMILDNNIKNNRKTLDTHELYLLQSYADFLSFLEAKYEKIDQWLSTNRQNGES